jgi:hypothetical protein
MEQAAQILEDIGVEDIRVADVANAMRERAEALRREAEQKATSRRSDREPGNSTSALRRRLSPFQRRAYPLRP